jgi:hypothetical protein
MSVNSKRREYINSKRVQRRAESKAAAEEARRLHGLEGYEHDDKDEWRTHISKVSEAVSKMRAELALKRESLAAMDAVIGRLERSVAPIGVPRHVTGGWFAEKQAADLKRKAYITSKRVQRRAESKSAAAEARCLYGLEGYEHDDGDEWRTHISKVSEAVAKMRAEVAHKREGLAAADGAVGRLQRTVALIEVPRHVTGGWFTTKSAIAKLKR